MLTVDCVKDVLALHAFMAKSSVKRHRFQQSQFVGGIQGFLHGPRCKEVGYCAGRFSQRIGGVWVSKRCMDVTLHALRKYEDFNTKRFYFRSLFRYVWKVDGYVCSVTKSTLHVYLAFLVALYLWLNVRMTFIDCVVRKTIFMSVIVHECLKHSCALYDRNHDCV